MKPPSHDSTRFPSGVSRAIVAPKVHTYLPADALFAALRKAFSNLCDHRAGTPDIALSDALMSAFAMFSLTSPSLLAFDKERGQDNVHQIYGIQHVPCDTSMREILDPVEPAFLRPVFQHVFDKLHRGKVLKEMKFVPGHSLLALDGPGYFSSQQIHCASC